MEWAVKTLFTSHLGNSEKKNKLASKLMGISTETVAQVFNQTSSTLPTLYLITIGTVKDLRVTLVVGPEYADDALVCKGSETELFKIFDKMNYKFVHSKYTELIIFSPKDTYIAKKYTGHIQEIVDKLKETDSIIHEKDNIIHGNENNEER